MLEFVSNKHDDTVALLRQMLQVELWGSVPLLRAGLCTHQKDVWIRRLVCPPKLEGRSLNMDGIAPSYHDILKEGCCPSGGGNMMRSAIFNKVSLLSEWGLRGNPFQPGFQSEHQGEATFFHEVHKEPDESAWEGIEVTQAALNGLARRIGEYLEVSISRGLRLLLQWIQFLSRNVLSRWLPSLRAVRCPWQSYLRSYARCLTSTLLLLRACVRRSSRPWVYGALATGMMNLLCPFPVTSSASAS